MQRTVLEEHGVEWVFNYRKSGVSMKFRYNEVVEILLPSNNMVRVPKSSIRSSRQSLTRPLNPLEICDTPRNTVEVCGIL